MSAAAKHPQAMSENYNATGGTPILPRRNYVELVALTHDRFR
jgi:hypothetical protein